MATRPPASTRQLVLVTGSTRSGTSLAAGTLHHLGLIVPQPVLKANDSNPAGFFESTWPVKFHKRLLDSALVAPTDSRPEAFGLVDRAITPAIRRELRSWLSGVFAEAPRIVVKDPRSMWAPALWADAADGLGARIGLLAMIRHPAEVVASRWTYYGSTRPGLDEWRYQVRGLCTWINANLGMERETRDRRRAFVRYDALLDDWRRAMRAAGDALAVDLAIDDDGPHAVDAFIDPDLRRHGPSWSGMDLPLELIEIAEGVWASLGAIADGEPDPDATARELDALDARYAEVIRRSQAIAYDTMVAFARVRVQIKTMDLPAPAPDADAEGAPEPAVLATAATSAADGVPLTTQVRRVARRRMRRAFRRWVKRPLVRTA